MRPSTRMGRMAAKRPDCGVAFGDGSAGAREGAESTAPVQCVQKCPRSLFTHRPP